MSNDLGLDNLDKIIKKEYRVDNDELSEPSCGMKRKIITNPRVISDYKIYRFDTSSDVIFPYFNKGYGLRQMCDYIIFVRTMSNKLFILLFELKKNKESPRSQLDKSEIFIKFILDRARYVKLWDIDENDIEIRKLDVTDRDRTRETGYTGEVKYENRYNVLFKEDKIRLVKLLH